MPLKASNLIKECVMEVLKEDLMEGFDPLSQGPNMATENPYPEWNEKMRRLEEEPAEHPHGRYAQQAGATPFETPQDYQEVKGHRLQSTEVPWMCPHCQKETQIHVDIESPSDYIASNECEHCGQEINDPQLDSKVMQSIADYYAGRADYYKDLLREGFGGARLLNAKITNISAAGTPAQGTMGAVGKYTEYNVTAEVNLTVYSDSTDKALIAKDVYTRLRSALH